MGFQLRITRGHYRRHKLEAVLCLLGVAMGVAVVIGIDAAVDASIESFQGAVQTLAERSTHSIFSSSQTITDQQYADLVRLKLPIGMAPVVDRGVLISLDRNDHELVGRLLGIDPFSERSLRSFTRMQTSLDATALERFLTEPGTVVLVDQLAARLGARVGDSLRMSIIGRRVTATIVGIVKPTGVARAQLSDLIICDIATAQELAGLLGQIDRIDVNIETAEQEQLLSASLPKGLELRSTQQRKQSLSELIGSYKLNLNALSLMASFVAVFIVYNSMLISVQQRTKTLGILRCLGAGPMQLGAGYLTDAVLFSVVGGVLGVLGGWLLSRGLVGYVATTINDLYASIRPGPVRLVPRQFAKGLLVSAVSCLMGVMIPLIRAAQTPPINAMQRSERAGASGRIASRLLWVGLGLLVLSAAIYKLPTESPLIGFAMAALTALGFAFTCPWMTHGICRGLIRVARRLQWLPLQMAGSGVSRSLGITGVAIAATMLAMSMNVGVRTMVRSFRSSLADWVEHRFAADVFVGPELLVNHKIEATLNPAVVTWVKLQPQVKEAVEYRARNIVYAGKSIMLTASNVQDLLKAGSLPMKSMDTSGRPFDSQQDAMISEPLAGRTKLRVGDTLELDSPSGPIKFKVYGIFFDFGSERGQVTLDRHTYAAAWRDDSINSLHVTLKNHSQAEATAAAWAAALRKDYPVVANSFGHLKNEVLTVFDRTFKVTEVLTWLAGGVAFCGLAGSLLAVSLARRKDYSVLAAIGMSSRQTTAWVVAQGLIMAWISAWMAAISGTVLAYVLAYVIQYRSFGWSIPTRPQPRFWLECLVQASIAAVLAAAYPIYRLRSAAPAGNLRAE